jgi:Icc-related predicted phosphoesterase
MKILALSDLHLEFRCQGISQIVNHGPDLSAYKGKVDVVILAGDIGIGEQTWTYREDLEAYMRVPCWLYRAIMISMDRLYSRGKRCWRGVESGIGCM